MVLSVLIVDDEHVIRQGLRTMLQEFLPVETGYIEASDGTEALSIVKKVPVHLILCDIRMSKTDGIQVLQTLGDLHLDIPFIFLTGYDDFSYAKTAIRLGAKDYLLKPVDMAELHQAVNKALDTVYGLTNRFHGLLQFGHLEQLSKESDYYRLLEEKKILNPELDPTIDPQKTPDSSHTRDLLKDLWEYPYVILMITAKAHDVRLQELQNHFQTNQISSYYLGKIAYHTFLISIQEPGSEIKLLDDLSRFVTSHPFHVVSLSDSYESKLQLSQGIQDATDLLLERYVQDSKVLTRGFISYSSDSKGINSGIIHTCYSLLGTGNYQKVIDELASQLFNNTSHLKKSLNYYRHLFATIFSDLVMAVDKELPEDQRLLRSLGIVLSDIHNFFDLDEYQHFLWEYIQQADLIFEELRKSRKKLTAIDLAMEYLESNYQDSGISMEVVAQHIQMNYSYFSVVFKDHTGSNFVTYLNRLRIKRAQELLSDPLKRISEVAYEVGYLSSRQFSKCFKQITGMLPQEFRKK